MPADHSTARGNAAEDAALAWLEDQGLQFVTRNYRCKTGEIDLIMLDRSTLVFVEVRLRNNRNHLTGADSITHRKMRRLIRTATWYLAQHPQSRDVDYRFDVVSMGAETQWIKDAFTLDSRVD